MQQPDPTVPAAMAAFAGKWGGKWGGILASNLYVESIGPDGTARGIYAWDNAANNSFARGAEHFRGKITGATLRWESSVRLHFEFQMLADGNLEGSRIIDGNKVAKVIMTRMSMP